MSPPICHPSNSHESHPILHSQELGSSLSLAAPLETVMLGIVLGTVPITVFGLLVSAWLQFKKGPTLGI